MRRSPLLANVGSMEAPVDYGMYQRWKVDRFLNSDLWLTIRASPTYSLNTCMVQRNYTRSEVSRESFENIGVEAYLECSDSELACASSWGVHLFEFMGVLETTDRVWQS